MISHENAAPVSERLMLVLSEAELHGLRAPICCSVVAANHSAVVVGYDGSSPQGFTLVCGSVQREGYAMPAIVTMVDRAGVPLLARLTNRGYEVLFAPPAGARAGRY
jgi:hypothetical protein